MRRTTTMASALAALALLAGCSTGSDTGTDQPSSSTTPPASESATPSATPAAATAIGPEFFGVHDHDPVGDAPAGWPDARVGSLRAWDAGVTWREIEASPGVFNFSRLDAMVDTAESHHADVLLVLGQTPVFHAKNPTVESFYGEGASSEPDLTAWKTYVRKVAERYAGRPVILQVWNEANVSGFWSAGPEKMAELTKATHDVLSTIDHAPTLVAPALVTRLSTQQQWIDQFYATNVDGKPVADFIDVVSLQLYPEATGTPAASMELLGAMRKLLQSHGVDKPIWNTEINYGLTGKPVKPAPENEQVMNIVATYLLNAANGVQRVYWYGWDQQQIVNTLLVEPDLATRTPAGQAFVTVRKWMVGATVTSCKVDAEGTYTCTLDHPAGPRTVYWNAEGAATVTVPEGATTSQKVGEGKKPAQPGAQLRVGLVPVMVRSGT